MVVAGSDAADGGPTEALVHQPRGETARLYVAGGGWSSGQEPGGSSKRGSWTQDPCHQVGAGAGSDQAGASRASTAAEVRAAPVGQGWTSSIIRARVHLPSGPGSQVAYCPCSSRAAATGR